MFLFGKLRRRPGAFQVELSDGWSGAGGDAVAREDIGGETADGGRFALCTRRTRKGYASNGSIAAFPFWLASWNWNGVVVT